MAALMGIIALLGWLYQSAADELAITKGSLAIALEANETNMRTIYRMEQTAENTSEATIKHDLNRTEMASVRQGIEKDDKEARSDEVYQSWADEPLPAVTARLLEQARCRIQNRNCEVVPARGSDAGLRTN